MKTNHRMKSPRVAGFTLMIIALMAVPSHPIVAQSQEGQKGTIQESTTLESTSNAAEMINRYPDRFLFGTDEVAPPNQEKYLKVYYQYEPLWKLLNPEASEKVRKGNYERIFDEGRRKVRYWERAHLK